MKFIIRLQSFHYPALQKASKGCQRTTQVLILWCPVFPYYLHSYDPVEREPDDQPPRESGQTTAKELWPRLSLPKSSICHTPSCATHVPFPRNNYHSYGPSSIRPSQLSRGRRPGTESIFHSTYSATQMAWATASMPFFCKGTNQQTATYRETSQPCCKLVPLWLSSTFPNTHCQLYFPHFLWGERTLQLFLLTKQSQDFKKVKIKRSSSLSSKFQKHQHLDLGGVLPRQEALITLVNRGDNGQSWLGEGRQRRPCSFLDSCVGVCGCVCTTVTDLSSERNHMAPKA